MRTIFKKYRLIYILICILILISFLIIVIAKGKIYKKEENAEQIFKSLMKLSTKDFSQAERLIRKIIKQAPESEYATISFDIIAELYSQSKFDKKLIKLYEDIECKPIQFSSDSLFLVGSSYNCCNKYKQVAEIVLKIKEDELNIEYLEAYYFMAIISFYELEQIELGKKYLNLFIEHYPDKYDIFAVVASIFQDKNKINEALDYYQSYFLEFINQKEKCSDSELVFLLYIQSLFIKQKMYEQVYVNLSNLNPFVSKYSALYEEYIYELGISAYQSGEFKVARENFEYILNNSRDQSMIRICDYYNDKIKFK